VREFSLLKEIKTTFCWESRYSGFQHVQYSACALPWDYISKAALAFKYLLGIVFLTAEPPTNKFGGSARLTTYLCPEGTSKFINQVVHFLPEPD